MEDACIRNGDSVDANLAEGGEKARDRLRHRAASSYSRKQRKTGSKAYEFKMSDALLFFNDNDIFGFKVRIYAHICNVKSGFLFFQDVIMA